MIIRFKICVGFCWAPFNMAVMNRHSFTLDPMGILHFRQHAKMLSQFKPIYGGIDF